MNAIGIPNGLHISLKGYEKIFAANGVKILVTENGDEIRVLFNSVLEKTEYNYKKTELERFIKYTTKNLELFTKNPIKVMKVRAQKIAIGAYLQKNKLFY